LGVLDAQESGLTVAARVERHRLGEALAVARQLQGARQGQGVVCAGGLRVELQGDGDVGEGFAAVDGADVEVFDAGGGDAFKSDRPDDAAAGQGRAPVPAELVLGLADVRAGRVAEIQFGELAVAVHQHLGMGGGRVELDEQPVVARPQQARHVEAVGDEHVVGFADELIVKPDLRDGVEPVEDKVDAVAGQQVIVGIEYVAVDPRFVADVDVLGGACVDVGAADPAGVHEAGVN